MFLYARPAAAPSSSASDDPLRSFGGAASSFSEGTDSSSSSSSYSSSEADLTPALVSITADSDKKYVYAFEEWSSKKAGILKKYTTNAAIPVVANFMEEKLQNGAGLNGIFCNRVVVALGLHFIIASVNISVLHHVSLYFLILCISTLLFILVRMPNKSLPSSN